MARRHFGVGTHHEAEMDYLVWIVSGTFGILAYFTPALIANRKHPQANAIAVVSLFLGRALLGWGA